jgi:hypothetical protein
LAGIGNVAHIGPLTRLGLWDSFRQRVHNIMYVCMYVVHQSYPRRMTP